MESGRAVGVKRVVVLDYDPTWPDVFERLRAPVWSAVGGFARTIEHVGSTAVPGLSAKPVIDMTVVLASGDDMPRAIHALSTLGYQHRGDLGVEGREAFSAPAELPDHHLYVCPPGSLGLRNHLAVRDYLRTHVAEAQTYGELKKRLALQHPRNIEAYIDGKTDFILAILERARLDVDELDRIEAANRSDR